MTTGPYRQDHAGFMRRRRMAALAGGHPFFNRARLAESFEILAEVLHPDAFDFGHRGRGWELWGQAPAKERQKRNRR